MTATLNRITAKLNWRLVVAVGLVAGLACSCGGHNGIGTM